MGDKKKLVGKVKIARATAGMTKFLTLPVETAPKPATSQHGIAYQEWRDRYHDGFDIADSETVLVDA